MKLETLNDKIIYARGWNDAVKAAAAIALKSEPDYGAPHYIAEEILKLDRSMQACND